MPAENAAAPPYRMEEMAENRAADRVLLASHVIREVGAEQGALPAHFDRTFLRSVTALSSTRPAYVAGQNAVGSEERFAACHPRGVAADA